MAVVKRSPKRRANCDLAMDHSRGGMIHSFSERFKTRKRSFVAASSLGKCPLTLTALRSLAFSASMAFVTGMKVGGADLSGGIEWFWRMVRPSGTEAPGARGAGRPINSMSRELELVAGRLC